MNLVWSPNFRRMAKRAVQRNPDLRERIRDTLRLLTEDPFYPKLHSHKLEGELSNLWACTLDYDNRIIFKFASNPETGEKEIVLLALGKHDEVY
ncbi:MAG: type II toxin-antitoxin system YafQ family toxin [Candidatus Poribacteria bacterium]